MSILQKYGAYIFFSLLLVHCVFIYLDIDVWRTATKLALIPFLIFYLVASKQQPVHALTYAALVFSFAGDVLLVFSGEMVFIAGMLAFMATHVCNSIVFAKRSRPASVETKGMAVLMMVLMTIALLALGGYVFCALHTSLGQLLVPVAIYMIVISVMAVLAAGVLRNAVWAVQATRWFIPGAALFAVSDAVLALNKFSWHEQRADIVVMATYGLAQYCLVRGFAGRGISMKPSSNEQ